MVSSPNSQLNWSMWKNSTLACVLRQVSYYRSAPIIPAVFSVIQEGHQRNSVYAFIFHCISKSLTRSSSSCGTQRTKEGGHLLWPSFLCSLSVSSKFLLMWSITRAGNFKVNHQLCLNIKNTYRYILFLIVFPCPEDGLQHVYLTYSSVSPRPYKREPCYDKNWKRK